jgi:hypothetical protein
MLRFAKLDIATFESISFEGACPAPCALNKILHSQAYIIHKAHKYMLPELPLIWIFRYLHYLRNQMLLCHTQRGRSKNQEPCHQSTGVSISASAPCSNNFSAMPNCFHVQAYCSAVDSHWISSNQTSKHENSIHQTNHSKIPCSVC